jgi:MFS family permease
LGKRVPDPPHPHRHSPGVAALTHPPLPPGGVSASHLDIAPRHAGVIFGVGNSAGTLAGLVGVPITGWVLHHTGSWALAFALAAVHNVLGAAVWARWAGGSRLPEDGGPAPEALPTPAPAGAAKAAPPGLPPLPPTAELLLKPCGAVAPLAALALKKGD